MRGYNVTMEQIANNLKPFAGRPIVDETDVTSRFSFELKVPRQTPPPAPSPRLPADPGMSNTQFADALKDQLGLKLKSTRRSINVLVIDSVQWLSPN